MLSRFIRRLSIWLRPQAFDADVQREIDCHMAMDAEHRRAAGAAGEDAAHAARRAFGNARVVREQVRDARGVTFWDSLTQDLRFGWRTLTHAPGYALTVVTILALGIGVNTAMFSVINGVLLEPLPFREPDRLVLVQQAAQASNVTNANVSIPELQDYRARLASIRDLVEYHSMSFVLLDQGEPDRVDTGVVSSNFFDVLGVRPELGRTFADADDDLGADAVLVLSHAYWQRRFGSDPHVIGRVLQMNNRPHTVIGVLPAFPQYPRENDVYMPTSACPFRAAEEAHPSNGHRSFAGLRVFGRLAPGASVTSASAEVQTIAQSFEHDFAHDHLATRTLGFTGRAASLGEQLVTEARPRLAALAGVTLLVLVIACANVANLALARTLRRGRELAVRTALGAGRGRLVRQLVTESLLVSVAGGLLGLLFAWLSLGLLVPFVSRFTTRTAQIAIDGPVLAFALVAGIVSGVAFGLVPALMVRGDLARSMREGGAQAGTGAGRHRTRAGLVVAQVAMSFALLVGAALLLQSFYRLASVPLGFDTERVLTAAVFGNFSTHDSVESTRRIERTILDRLRSSPGVRSAALTNAIPQSRIQPLPLSIEIEGQADDGGSAREADQAFASDAYFHTLGVPLVTGRDFRDADGPDAPPVAIVNESMARFWKDADPVGRRFRQRGADQPWVTVVGVVGDFRLFSADHDLLAEFYQPLTQNPGYGVRLLVRSDADLMTLVPAIKAAVHAADPGTPVEDVATLAEVRQAEQLAAPRLTAALLSIFAAVAFAITLAGLAGLIGTSVSERTREFGVRMALGASRGAVLRLVLGQGVWLVAAGTAAGLVGAYAFSRLLTRYLFATTPTDPYAYAAVALLFLLAALAATFAPARRATTIDPLIALKGE